MPEALGFVSIIGELIHNVDIGLDEGTVTVRVQLEGREAVYKVVPLLTTDTSGLKATASLMLYKGN